MGEHDPRPDALLLGGDAEAFAAFYRRHEDATLRYFLRRVRGADVTADLTAETFARALARRASYDPQLGDGRAWLFGIARNVLLRSLERGRVEDRARRRLGMEPVVLTDAALVRVEELAEAAATQALDELPAEQRIAVRGRVLDERTYAELAEELRCSESVVRQRVSRGLRALRARLEESR